MFTSNSSRKHILNRRGNHDAPIALEALSLPLKEPGWHEITRAVLSTSQLRWVTHSFVARASMLHEHGQIQITVDACMMCMPTVNCVIFCVYQSVSCFICYYMVAIF